MGLEKARTRSPNMPEQPKDIPGKKPATKTKKKRRPPETVSDDELELRIAMRATGVLDEDTDPVNEEDSE
jgi:hypothetical protein